MILCRHRLAALALALLLLAACPALAEGQRASLAGGAAELGEGATVVAAYIGGSESAATDASGAFRFDGLQAGQYSVYAPMPEGLSLAADSAWRLAEGGEQCWVTVSVEAGEALELPALAFATDAQVDGFAYLDADGSGAYDASEPLLAGVPYALERVEGGASAVVASGKTNEYGKFSVGGLSAGTYRLACGIDSASYYVSSLPAEFALRQGQQSAGEAVIGLRQTAALSVTAYADGNRDGARGAGEAGVAGVKVQLLDGEALLAEGETDAGGELRLAALLPGERALRVTAPAGYGVTSAPQAVTLTSGETAEATVGVSPAGSFSGKVFEDVSDDGLMDADEPGVAGVVLRLVGKKTGVVRELTTDESGLYAFTDLPKDSYTFTATLPEGMLFARYSKTGGDLRSVFTGSTTARQYAVSQDAPQTDKNVGVIERGAVAGTAFTDLNYNGVYDEGEPGFAGLTLELIKVTTSDSVGRTVTGADGAYAFEGLRGGSYRLRAILPDDGVSEFTLTAQGENANLFQQRDGRRENSIQPVEVGSGAVTRTLVGVAVGATVRGIVYQDEDYSGAQNGREKLLSGVRVLLADAAGNVAATAVTNAKGEYTLAGVMPGTYTVQVQRKANYGFTRLRPEEARGNCVTELVGDYGVTAPIVITMGQSVDNVNAGMLPSATVAGAVYNDADDDGQRGEGEGGLAGIKVRLASADGEIDLTRDTDENGGYFFDGVMPGDYTLTYQLPQHAELAKGSDSLTADGLAATTAPFAVAMGAAAERAPVGVVVLGSFEGFVFHDSAATGDGTGERLAGARVTLAPDRAGLDAQTVTTGADGAFSLTGLRPAAYTLTVELPEGYILSHDAGTLALAAAASDTLACGWDQLTDRQPKLIGAARPAAISGTLWLDENRDAAHQSAEAQLGGVAVELVDEATGLVAARATTGKQGFAFAEVRPGRYRLRFQTPSQSEPANEAGARFAQNGSYMICEGLSVAEGQSLTGLDAGLVSRTSVGGRVWLDENGQSTPVSGVTVSLCAGGEVVQTCVTGGDGSYRFDGLWPDEYALRSDLPAGAIFVRPGDANYAPGASVIATETANGGESEPFQLLMARHQLDRNVILIKPAKLGDQAWLDENANGLIDGGERLLPGVTVRLLSNGQVAYETQTDLYGYYQFVNVYPGEYTLEAVSYPAFGIARSVPELRIISSCLVSGDGQGARSDPFQAVSGVTDNNFDLGFVLLDGQAMPELPAAPAKDWTGANTPD